MADETAMSAASWSRRDASHGSRHDASAMFGANRLLSMRDVMAVAVTLTEWHD